MFPVRSSPKIQLLHSAGNPVVVKLQGENRHPNLPWKFIERPQMWVSPQLALLEGSPPPPQFQLEDPSLKSQPFPLHPPPLSGTGGSRRFRQKGAFHGKRGLAPPPTPKFTVDHPPPPPPPPLSWKGFSVNPHRPRRAGGVFSAKTPYSQRDSRESIRAKHSQLKPQLRRAKWG